MNPSVCGLAFTDLRALARHGEVDGRRRCIALQDIAAFRRQVRAGRLALDGFGRLHMSLGSVCPMYIRPLIVREPIDLDQAIVLAAISLACRDSRRQLEKTKADIERFAEILKAADERE